MSNQELLETITGLSHVFGNCGYVRGGGGNTSCKTDATMWIKPSGLALADMTPDRFIALSRSRLNELYRTSFPAGDRERESAVKDFIATAILPCSSGRPSVETPLHNAFPQRYVVHTHPALANAMTCGQDGEAACARLFPAALWVGAVDPGYTLSMTVRKEILAYKEKNGAAPEMLFLGNHGVFIAHDEPDGINELYNKAMDAIGAVINDAGIRGMPERNDAPGADVIDAAHAKARAIMQDEAAEIAASGWFKIPTGAITPDHIVYCRSYMFQGEPDAGALKAYRDSHGCWPRVIATENAVYGFGSSRKTAILALEMAMDGATVERYAKAFGGIKYLDERFVRFIEDWEVESYRRKQAQ